MQTNKKNTIKIALGFIVLTSLLTYQNCAEFTGSGDNEFTSFIPEDKVPECKVLSSSNFNPTLDYSWATPTSFPIYKQVIASPSVGDINADGYPEIAFVSFQGTNYQANKNGVLRVLDGKTKTELISIGSLDIAPSGGVTPLLIDIDGDGKGEIIYPYYNSNEVIALNNDGSLRWRANTSFSYNCYGGFSGADLNGDGTAEIIKNGEILYEVKNSDGTYNVMVRRYKETGNGCSHFAMNLTTSDASMSIIDSTGVYDLRNGQYSPRFSVINLQCGFSCFAGAADVDSTFPGKEIIYTGAGSFRIYSASGQLITNKNLTDHYPEDRCVYSDGDRVGGGSATIGDFDGDESTVEFAIATGRSLTIFDKSGNKIAGSRTNDCSSLATGVTSFDFNGDGKPEILYNDETNFKVYKVVENSADLEVLWETPNTTGTLWEYPVVADLDNDYSPEIIVVSNQVYSGTSGQNGLRIYTANKSTDQWMPTRGVWNQHNYFISNVDLNLRATSSTSVTDQLAKNFRRNLPGQDLRCKSR